MRQVFDLVMTEHTAWRPATAGRQRVFASPEGGRWLVQVNSGNVTLQTLAPGGPLAYGVFTCPEGVAAEVPGLAAALAGLGVVARFRNPDLWNALATAIIRQVIRASQAKALYWAFCEAYGERLPLPGGGTYALFPTAETVLTLDSDEYSSVGMAFKRRPLKAAAHAYLEHGTEWQRLAPPALADELQTVSRVGPWTAYAAVADWSNNWSLYPYGDAAVRAGARRAAPGYDWPTDEKTFGRLWRRLAGEHLSTLTLLTLALGSTHGNLG